MTTVTTATSKSRMCGQTTRKSRPPIETEEALAVNGSDPSKDARGAPAGNAANAEPGAKGPRTNDATGPKTGADRRWRLYALDLQRQLAAASVPRPSFSGTQKKTIEFLREFEEYCTEAHKPSSSKLGEVLKCIKRDAKTWTMANRDR